MREVLLLSVFGIGRNCGSVNVKDGLGAPSLKAYSLERGLSVKIEDNKITIDIHADRFLWSSAFRR